MYTRRVLLAEDDETLRRQLARAIRGMGWEVTEYGDGRALLDGLDALGESGVCTFLVTDVRMPNLDGLDLLTELALRRRRLPTVVITAFADEDTRQAVRALGASIVFSKPFDVDDLCTALQFLPVTKPA